MASTEEKAILTAIETIFKKFNVASSWSRIPREITPPDYNPFEDATTQPASENITDCYVRLVKLPGLYAFENTTVAMQTEWQAYYTSTLSIGDILDNGNYRFSVNAVYGNNRYGLTELKRTTDTDET
jgi:hypothetical protein